MRTASPLAITALSTQAHASESHAAVGSSKRRSTLGFPCDALEKSNRGDDENGCGEKRLSG